MKVSNHDIFMKLIFINYNETQYVLEQIIVFTIVVLVSMSVLQVATPQTPEILDFTQIVKSQLVTNSTSVLVLAWPLQTDTAPTVHLGTGVLRKLV